MTVFTVFLIKALVSIRDFFQKKKSFECGTCVRDANLDKGLCRAAITPSH